MVKKLRKNKNKEDAYKLDLKKKFTEGDQVQTIKILGTHKNEALFPNERSSGGKVCKGKIMLRDGMEEI